MTDRVLPVLLMLAVTATWWSRPAFGALREWRREQRRLSWDRSDEWHRAMDGLGGKHE